MIFLALSNYAFIKILYILTLFFIIRFIFLLVSLMINLTFLFFFLICFHLIIFPPLFIQYSFRGHYCFFLNMYFYALNYWFVTTNYFLPFLHYLFSLLLHQTTYFNILALFILFYQYILTLIIPTFIIINEFIEIFLIIFDHNLAIGFHYPILVNQSLIIVELSFHFHCFGYFIVRKLLLILFHINLVFPIVPVFVFLFHKFCQ